MYMPSRGKYIFHMFFGAFLIHAVGALEIRCWSQLVREYTCYLKIENRVNTLSTVWMNFESAVFLLIILIIKIIEIIQIYWKFIRKKTTFKDSSLSLLTISRFKPKLNHWLTVLLYSLATFIVYLSVWIHGLPENDQNHDEKTIIDITRLNSEKLNFILWRFFIVKKAFLIQWVTLILVI